MCRKDPVIGEGDDLFPRVYQFHSEIGMQTMIKVLPRVRCKGKSLANNEASVRADLRRFRGADGRGPFRGLALLGDRLLPGILSSRTGLFVVGVLPFPDGGAYPVIQMDCWTVREPVYVGAEWRLGCLLHACEKNGGWVSSGAAHDPL